MKPTTYIIGGLVLVGAIASGVAGYMTKGMSLSLNSLAPYEFTDSVAVRHFEPVDNVAILYRSALPKNTEVYFASGIQLEVTENSDITSPVVEVSESWLPLLDLRQTERDGKSTLDIIVDCHGLADYYSAPEGTKKMEIHLDAPAINLVMPAGMLSALSSDEKCRVHLQDMGLGLLDVCFNNRMTIENCEINSLNISISGLNEYSTTYHLPEPTVPGEPIPSVKEFEYSYLHLKHSSVRSADISVVAPALTVTGPCHIDTLAINAQGIDRENQYVELRPMVEFDVLDWRPDNASLINLEIHDMPAGHFVSHIKD
ncbi:MAG: hypothetical protein HDS81_04805 [Bacteroidales bacterium]|nr:hypothetical protein [Bacteroidales bacterium]